MVRSHELNQWTYRDFTDQPSLSRKMDGHEDPGTKFNYIKLNRPCNLPDDEGLVARKKTRPPFRPFVADEVLQTVQLILPDPHRQLLVGWPGRTASCLLREFNNNLLMCMDAPDHEFQESTWAYVGDLPVTLQRISGGLRVAVKSLHGAINFEIPRREIAVLHHCLHVEWKRITFADHPPGEVGDEG